jgi:hypothetical protein
MLMQGISDMAGTYAENKAKKAKGAAYKKAFDVVGPSLGMNEETLKQFGGQFKNDNDWYEFGETMFPSLGVVSNLRDGQPQCGYPRARAADSAAHARAARTDRRQQQAAPRGVGNQRNHAP